jgi:hypothetical protein
VYLLILMLLWQRYVHVRGGFLIPMQIPGPNLMIGRGNPFILLVVQPEPENATGNLYWNDGDRSGERIFDNNINHTHLSLLDSVETKTYNYLEFSLSMVSSVTERELRVR